MFLILNLKALFWVFECILVFVYKLLYQNVWVYLCGLVITVEDQVASREGSWEGCRARTIETCYSALWTYNNQHYCPAKLCPECMQKIHPTSVINKQNVQTTSLMIFKQFRIGKPSFWPTWHQMFLSIISNLIWYLFGRFRWKK